MPQPSATAARDPFHGRRPTIHEQASGQPWDASYTGDGPAPWDLGRPQGAIARLISRGVFRGEVLDAGCGTGEHTLLLASLGLKVLGVDVAETALARARKKALDRGINAEFAEADGLHLERLERKFDSVLDCGLLHCFEGEERSAYAKSVASVTRENGTLFVLCFSSEGPDTGPHPVRREELMAAFNPIHGWEVVALETERIESHYHPNGVSAWLATVKRV
jgi:SAM-dependent methyltransferase